MRRPHLSRVWRRSIQVRVVASTVLLSTLVIVLTGWGLLRSVASGLADHRREVALSQAKAGFDQAQAQLDASVDVDAQSQADSLSQVVDTIAATRGGSRSYDLVLIGPLTASGDAPVRSSGDVSAGDLPADLVRAVRRSNGNELWRYTKVTAGSGDTTPYVVVGRRLTAASTASSYELYYAFSMSDQVETLHLVTQRLLAGGAMMVILVGAVSWIVARQVVAPMGQARRIAEQFAAGHLEQRMQVRGEDDIARVSLALNRMAESLQSQIVRLENLSRLQQRFVSDVSHELRTPLTTVQMASDVLYESRGRLEPQAARSAELLRTQLDRFASLLSDLLDLSRFDAGAAVLELDDVDLAAIARSAARDGRLAAAGIVATTRGAKDPAIVLADIRRVDRIVRNLVNNAIAYSGTARLELIVAQDDTAVSLSVRDFGIGMDEDEQRRVFDRFWRGDPARPQGGTGLGLAIAREDAALHRGQLQVWSRPGLGTEFVLTLPKLGQVVTAPVLRSVFA